jgi:hypothetical protein
LAAGYLKFPSMTAKEEVKKWPFVGTISNAINVFFFNRNSSTVEARQVIVMKSIIINF